MASWSTKRAIGPVLFPGLEARLDLFKDLALLLYTLIHALGLSFLNVVVRKQLVPVMCLSKVEGMSDVGGVPYDEVSGTFGLNTTLRCCLLANNAICVFSKEQFRAGKP